MLDRMFHLKQAQREAEALQKGLSGLDYQSDIIQVWTCAQTYA